MKRIAEQKLVWMDTDMTIGRRRGLFNYCDVDDAYALAALMRCDRIEVIGLSTTLGNTDDIEVSTTTAKKFVSSYGPNSIPIYKGCNEKLTGKGGDVQSNEAVEALAATLKNNRLTILGVGAATNIAILLLKHPEVRKNIDEIVLVAGRRSIDSHFISGKWQPKPFRDLNFEFDPKAMEILLASDVKIVLVPFESCKQVWIKPHDLIHLGEANEVGKFLATNSLGWIAEWETIFGADGFNPFDMVAAGYVMAPEYFTSYRWHVQIEEGPDDTDDEKVKPYLICNKNLAKGKIVTYCTKVDPECKPYMMKRVCTHDMEAFVLGTSHVNVIVPSVEEATEYYGRVLGFKQAYDHDGSKMDYTNVKMEAFAVDAGIADGKVDVDVRFLKHPQAELYLELMTYRTPKGSEKIPVQPKTYDLGGPRHIAMEVSNCKEVFSYLSEQEGVTMINRSSNYHPVKLDGFPITFFYWVDQYGIQWEMEEGRRIGTSRGII
jgi:inosine-uridine nucleoside N-ribohydrolase/catechol 2,3-dioxygenase-like lactoylglutathione lyase family enzyme